MNKQNITNVLIILLILIVGMWQIVFFQSMMKWDIIDINLPWRYFTSECLRNGILPLWNPFITTGFPQTADPMTWYPMSWLIGIIFGNSLITIQYEYILHLFIGALGIYKIGDLFHFNTKAKLAISIAFMFSGLFISNAQHFGWVVSGAWFPLVIYYYIRFCKSLHILPGLLFVLCFYCMLSGGYPAFFIITAYILLVIFGYFLFKEIKNKEFTGKYILANVLTTMLFLLMSAVVLMSSFELSAHSSRAEKFSVEFVQSFPLPYQGLLSFLFPYATTEKVDFFGNDFSMVNCYIGITALIFLLYALLIKNKKAIILTLAGLFLLSAALADVFPIRKILYYLPFMNTFRFPTVFRFFAYFCFILAAGIGLNHFITQFKKDKKLIISLLIVTVIILFFLIYNSFYIEKWKFKPLLFLKFDEFNKTASFNERIAFQAIIQLVFSGILLFSLFKLPFKSLTKILLFVIITDMILSAQLNIYNTVIYKDGPKPTQQALSNLVKGFPKPDLQEKITDNTENSNPSIPGLWRNMNIFYKKITSEGYTPYYLKDMVFAEKTGSYYQCLKNPAIFLADHINNKNIIDSNSIDSLSYKKIEIVEFSPNMISMKIHTDRKQLLTYLQNNYPGWTVLINNKEENVITTNYNFMSVWINPGQNTVKFEYRPKHIIRCFHVSAVFFILTLLLIFSLQIRKFGISTSGIIK